MDGKVVLVRPQMEMKNWKVEEGDPCYRVAKKLAELCFRAL